MDPVRRHLRAWIAVWLVCQFAALSTLGERRCCAADMHEGGANCHEETAAVFCPMRAADGTPCPMHREAPVEDNYSLRAKCGGPVAALATLLSSAGPVETAAFLPLLPCVATERAGTESLAGVIPLPEAPPPRA